MSINSNHLKSALLTVMAGAVLSACNGLANFNEELPGGGNFKISVDNDDAVETRSCVDPAQYSGGVTGLLWCPGDSIGVFSAEGSENAPFVNPSTGNVKNAVFDGTMGAVPEYAYFPYTAENDGRRADALVGRVNGIQKYDISTRKLSDDWKYGSRRSDYDAESGYRFRMRQLFSLVKLNVSADETEFVDQNLYSITLRVASPDGVRRICGDFSFNALTGDYSMSRSAEQAEDGVDNELRMDWEGAPLLSAGKTHTGYLTMVPDVHTGDTLVLTLNLSDYSVEYKVKLKVDFQPGYLYTLPMSLKGLEEKMMTDYRETPKKTVLPVLSSLKFTVADNSGKLLDKKLVTTTSSSKYSPTFSKVSEHTATIAGNSIDLVIPYLYNFNLVPRFAAPEGAVVAVDGQVLKSGETSVDWAHASSLSVTADGMTRVYDLNIRNTGLPVVVINQSTSGDFTKKYNGGLNIGGSNIGGTLLNQFVDFMVRGKDTEWVQDDQMTVYNADGSVDMVTTNCGVRLRGNSTQKLPKKPFAIKLTAKQSILGMPSHKRWCLLANWLDRSMIRNLLGFAAAKATTEAWKTSGIDEGMVWTPSGKSVELVFNGHHVGNYLLCEQIKIGSKRLNINDCYEDLVADGLPSAYEDCGYLVEFDVMQDETYKGVTSRGITWQLKDDVLPDKYFTSISDKIKKIEDAIKGGNFSEYSQLIDLPSFIDQWLIWELALNREYTEPRSIYAYINGGNDKLHAGPVWDFDRGTFQNPTEAQKMGSSRVKQWNAFLSSSSKVYKSGGYKDGQQPCMWYPLLMDDSEFVQLVKERWTVLYPYLQSVVGEIMRLGEENALSWTYDSTMWPGTASALNAGYPSGFSDFSGDENLTEYNAVIENLINCYLGRLDAMNTIITSATDSFTVKETTF